MSRDDLCKMTPEAAPMSDKANFSQLQSWAGDEQRDAGDTSKITYLRNSRKSNYVKQLAERKVRKMWDQDYCRDQVSEKGGEGGALDARTDSPTTQAEDHGKAGCPV